MDEFKLFLRRFFDVQPWQSRWETEGWTSLLGWIYIIGDLLTWTAYYTIPLIIIRYITRKKGLEFHRVYILFAAFILLCGTTHLFDAIIFWYPIYRLNAVVVFLTGIMSWITVIFLFKILPIAFSMKTREQLEREINTNNQLASKIQLSNSELADKNSLLETQRDFIETILDSTIDAINVFDARGVLVNMNKKSADLLGVDKKKYVGKHFTEIFGKDSPAYPDLLTALNGKEVKNERYYSKAYKKYFENYYKPLFNHNEVYAVVLLGHDITDVVTREKHLLELNETFNYAEAISKIGSYKYNLTSGRLEHSDNFYHMLGYNPEDKNMTPEVFQGLVDEKDKLKMASVTSLMFEKGETDTLEFNVQDRRGKTIHLRNSGKSFVNQAGEKIVIGVIQDISDDIEKAKDLSQKNSALEHANDELEQFAFVLSHDLQEPLRKIQIFLSLLDANNCVEEKFRVFLQKANSSAERMRNLISDVLIYSKISQQKLQLTEVDLNEVLSQVQTDFELAIHEKKAILHVDQLPLISGIKHQLGQLFSNLISNALKFTTHHPEISIYNMGINPGRNELGLDSTRSYICISVEDNGIGFEEKYKDKVFEMFQRLTSDSEFEGTGIGLSICKKVVENHEGYISVSSKKNEGTRFLIYLPIS